MDWQENAFPIQLIKRRGIQVSFFFFWGLLKAPTLLSLQGLVKGFHVIRWEMYLMKILRHSVQKDKKSLSFLTEQNYSMQNKAGFSFCVSEVRNNENEVLENLLKPSGSRCLLCKADILVRILRNRCHLNICNVVRAFPVLTYVLRSKMSAIPATFNMQHNTERRILLGNTWILNKAHNFWLR